MAPRPPTRVAAVAKATGATAVILAVALLQTAAALRPAAASLPAAAAFLPAVALLPAVAVRQVGPRLRTTAAVTCSRRSILQAAAVEAQARTATPLRLAHRAHARTRRAGPCASSPFLASANACDGRVDGNGHGSGEQTLSARGKKKTKNITLQDGV